jgi:hypothetical protein
MIVKPSSTFSVTIPQVGTGLSNSDFTVLSYKDGEADSLITTITEIGSSGNYQFEITVGSDEANYTIIVYVTADGAEVYWQFDFKTSELETNAEQARELTYNDSFFDPETQILTIYDKDGNTILYQYETDLRTFRTLIED